MFEQIDHKTPIDWLVTVDLNCPIVEAIKAFLHLKKYVNLKEPTHQYFKILEMLFLYSKSVPTCRSSWTWPRWSLSLWAENRVEWEHKVPGVCSTGLCMVRQELCSFLRKTSGPSNLEWNIVFYANLQPTPADEMYQDFENPEHGKFWSGGKGPVIWTSCFLFQHQGNFLKIQ